MKFSLTWLKEHLETDADAASVADTLTAIGLEVEGVHNPAEALAPFASCQGAHRRAPSAGRQATGADGRYRLRRRASGRLRGAQCPRRHGRRVRRARAPMSPAMTCPEGGGDPRRREPTA